MPSQPVRLYQGVITDVEVGVVRVGEVMSWASPKRARVESQHECGFSMSILKSPSMRMSAQFLAL